MASSTAMLLPDVLVLAGGGIVGEAWMHGVLGGIEDAAGADFRQVEAFVGTSAGSIVAARLAGGRPLRRPQESRSPSSSDWDAPTPTGSAVDGAGGARAAVGGALRGAARVG